MPITLQFTGEQIGIAKSWTGQGNGNTNVQVGRTPFRDADIIYVTFTDESFQDNGEFLEFSAEGDVTIIEMYVIRNGKRYDIELPEDGLTVYSSEGGTSDNQGDSYFITEDELGPQDPQGVFSQFPEGQLVFFAEGDLIPNSTVSLPRVLPGGNGVFDGLNGGAAPCFAAGTLIATPAGPRAVEDLRPGDPVLTRDAGSEDLVFTHGRRVEVGPASLAPVTIPANAFGPGRPSRDLTLSAQHRVLLVSDLAALWHGAREVLVPARALIGTFARPGPAGAIHWHHVATAAHHVILAEDLAVETLWPGEIARAALPPGARAALDAALSDAPLRPARPFLNLREGRVIARACLEEIPAARAPDAARAG